MGIELKTARDVRNFAGVLRKNPDKEEVLIRKACSQLINGGIWDLAPNACVTLITLMQNRGFKKEANKLCVHAPLSYAARKNPFQGYFELRRCMPDYFARQLERGAILGIDEMGKLSKAGIDEIFERLFSHATSFGLDILPLYQSDATRALEEEFFTTLNAVKCVKETDICRIRKSLGKRSKLFELKQVGKDLYTEVRRQGGGMGTGELEFKVAEAVPVPGPRFFATTVGGYHGFLKYYLEEVAQAAPEGANAYLDGTGILRRVECKGVWSPIIANKVLRPARIKDGEYHVVPVKFFRVSVDRSKKYKGKWEVTERDASGNPKCLQYKVTER